MPDTSSLNVVYGYLQILVRDISSHALWAMGPFAPTDEVLDECVALSEREHMSNTI